MTVGGDGRTTTQAKEPDRPKPPVPADWARGVNLTAYGRDVYAQPAAADALRALRAIGGTHVNVVTTWYVADRRSADLGPDGEKTPSEQGVLAILQQAESLGLKATLKPHVDARDGTFRGRLKPRDRPAFFTTYTDYVFRMAQLARQAGAERLIIGSELTSLSDDTDAWGAITDSARSAFDGKLTYAANWVQEAEAIGFWDRLDEVGVDAYMPLTQDNQPGVDSLVEDWGQWTKRVEALQRKTGKPVLFTELGYPARSNAPARPAVESQSQPVDPSQQDRLYEAAFKALAEVDGFAGVYWWDWPADGVSPPGAYAPRGKPAEQTMARYWARPDLPGGASGPTGASGASGSSGAGATGTTA